MVPPPQVVHGLLQGAAAELLEVASSCRWVTSSRGCHCWVTAAAFFLGGTRGGLLFQMCLKGAFKPAKGCGGTVTARVYQCWC